MKNYLLFALDAAWNTLKGLRVTFKVMLLPSITVQYPAEKLVPYPGFRGLLLYDAEKCIACGMCIKACPSRCINLASASSSEGKRLPRAAWYTLDYGKCNFCGLCEEACPTKPKALWHSLDYEAVFNNRNEMVRGWKPGDPLYGTVYEPRTKQFAKVTGQLHVQDVPVRK
jgi:formate hydrogenlyase subunit 6/NADH:ubiquinone oxidoreductase subunit I